MIRKLTSEPPSEHHDSDYIGREGGPTRWRIDFRKPTLNCGNVRKPLPDIKLMRSKIDNQSAQRH
jgi:hypothetical protein